MSSKKITWRSSLAVLLDRLLARPRSGPAGGPTTIRFATDWRAEAEQGGFYEALATGEYAKRGLAVTIIPGGPGVNVPQLVAAGAVEMGVGSNSFIVMNLAAEHVPVKAVAAFMQKGSAGADRPSGCWPVTARSPT